MSRRALPTLLLLLGWSTASWSARGRAWGIPSPLAVLRTGAIDVIEGALAIDLLATGARAVAGGVVATVSGASLGLALGLLPGVRRASEPLVDLLRAVPPVMAYPIFLLALGYGEASRIAAAAFGAFGAVTLPVMTAIARIPLARRDIARVAGLDRLSALRLLYLPEAAPALATGARLATSQALVITAATEMLVGPTHGLGVRALVAMQEYRPDRLWLAVLLAGGTSAALSALVSAAARRVEGNSIEDSER